MLNSSFEGRVLKDREVLASKHLSVRKKADKLNVGGGVCLWPGMQDMRLSQWEMVELLLVSVTLLVTVVYGFNKLHGIILYIQYSSNGKRKVCLFKDYCNAELTRSLCI